MMMRMMIENEEKVEEEEGGKNEEEEEFRCSMSFYNLTRINMCTLALNRAF